MPSYTIYIDGAAGTTGLQIYERLATQPDITVATLPEDQRKSLPHRLAAMEAADLSILCLPDDAAREIAAAAPAGAKICDASTAHRTDPAWVYGFPELGARRAQVAAAARVANPGCHATGFAALAAPLVERGILAKDVSLACTSLTGYSGGGKQMIAAYEAADRPKSYDAPRMYALGLAHKHLPEMAAVAGLGAPPLFCPVVDDYYCGMLVSLPLAAGVLAAGHQSRAALAAFYAEYYAGERLITVHQAGGAPADGTLSAGEMAGRDDLEIFILGNDEQILLCARFDNLGKGAAGAALQNANLMLGRDEYAGLRL